VSRPQNRTVEERIAAIASRAHGVVTRAELREAGLTTAEIKSRIASRYLIRVHRGVFRVGHQSPSLEAGYMAAVKACGEGSLLFGRAAAHLLGLLKRPPSLPEVLTVTQRRPRGVTTHRARRTDVIAGEARTRLTDATRWRRIPVTTVPRTLVDLAAVLDEDELARAVHQADVRHHTTPVHVEKVLLRRHNWPGASQLRRVIWGEVPVTLSKLESSFIAAVRRAGLPLPESNRRVDGRYVDCRWPKHSLTVELDSYRYHRTRHIWEQDRQREREARARRDEFRRYTWRDVDEEPEPMLADLRRLLGKPQLDERIEGLS
jgi:predicted transcriptional regulator of viral defense system